MNPQRESSRRIARHPRANVDTRNLAIEVVNGRLIVKGTLPSTDQQEQMRVLLSHCADQGLSLECDVSVLKAAPSDSLDGRGRSPITAPRPTRRTKAAISSIALSGHAQRPA